MPVDYSKWDALELSDDSDIEVHPNVDKRSFIRAKQNQIHAERLQRKNQIETLQYERGINDTLIARISSLQSSLKSRASDARSGNPGEVAFQAVMESAASLKPQDDQPPPRPRAVENSEEKQPTYTKMMATLLDQVHKALDERGVSEDERYDAMIAEIGEHLSKVQNLQKELHVKLAELEKEEGSKITSESIHTGFDSSFVNKNKSADASEGSGGAAGSNSVELLNPSYSQPSGEQAAKKPPTTGSGGGDNDDDELEASPAARKFSEISQGDYQASLQFLRSHPEILTERETDAILVLAFDAQLAGRADYARQSVHQALLLQYCRALGRDGVSLFFKRVTTPGHQAQGVFLGDVRDTYAKIRDRAAQINAQRAAGGDGAGGDGVEQIQLHAVEPGTVINIRIPGKDAEDEDEKRGREIFEGFKPEMRAALETGSLDEVNKVLGALPVSEAEEIVGLLGEASILSLEEQIIDATTEAGQEQLKKIELEASAGSKEAQQGVGDPE